MEVIGQEKINNQLNISPYVDEVRRLLEERLANILSKGETSQNIQEHFNEIKSTTEQIIRIVKNTQNSDDLMIVADFITYLESHGVRVGDLKWQLRNIQVDVLYQFAEKFFERVKITKGFYDIHLFRTVLEHIENKGVSVDYMQSMLYMHLDSD